MDDLPSKKVEVQRVNVIYDLTEYYDLRDKKLKVLESFTKHKIRKL